MVNFERVAVHCRVQLAELAEPEIFCIFTEKFLLLHLFPSPCQSNRKGTGKCGHLACLLLGPGDIIRCQPSSLSESSPLGHPPQLMVLFLGCSWKYFFELFLFYELLFITENLVLNNNLLVKIPGNAFSASVSLLLACHSHPTLAY